MEISTTTAPSSSRCSTNCTLLGKPVGFRCLASLLGVGGARLQRKAASGPDLRFGKKQHRSQPGTWTVDGFLQVAYDAVAETLPDELFVSKLAINLTTGGNPGCKTLGYLVLFNCYPKIFISPQLISGLLEGAVHLAQRKI